MAAVRERAAAPAVTVAELARIAQIASPRITRIACVGVFRLIPARKIGGAGSPEWLRGWARPGGADGVLCSAAGSVSSPRQER